MICILSESDNETCTENVMAWLRTWKVPHVRINGDDIDRREGLTVELSPSGATPLCHLRGRPFDLDQIRVVWYRRWKHANTLKPDELLSNFEPQDLSNMISAHYHLHQERDAVSLFLFHALRKAKWLGSHLTITPNKLQVLDMAAAIGLDIPATIVTTDAVKLESFMKKHGQVITKPSRDAMLLEDEGNYYMTYTGLVSERALACKAWEGFPSLCQERLSKSYELRSFFLEGKFYTAAIYTQMSKHTLVDARILDEFNPPRTIPYALPKLVEERLATLMNDLSLETGSIDLVRTKEGRLVFLEVNPVGQFEAHSRINNFHIERDIAATLVRRLRD